MQLKVRMNFRRILLTLSAALAVSIVGPPPTLAQNAGSIRGTVTDPSAAIVPGATVTVTGNNTSRTATTDGQGHFTIPNMPAGTYSVRADANGFVTFTNPSYQVSPGQESPLNISLQIASETQQVSVNDQANTSLSTDSSSNVSALVLKDADIDALPDDPDDLQSDLTALAGPAAGPNGAQFFVDGFSGGQLPPKSSIREIRINSNPFSSEYDAPGFGRVEILTKPGTDNYHGQAMLNYGDRIFDSRNPLLTEPQPAYKMLLGGFNFGGPLGKKTSFLIDYNRRSITENALIIAQLVPQQPPYNQAYLIPNGFWRIDPRIDYAINSSNTLVMRYDHTQASNFGGVGGFNLPSQETTTWQRNNQVQITETAVLGTVAVDETRFQFRDNHNNGAGLGDFSTPGLNVSGSFDSGGAPYTANDTYNKGYELQNILTTTRGKHSLKIGFRARQSYLTAISNSNFNGTWTFNAPLTGLGSPVCPNSVTSLDVYQQTQMMLAEGVPISTILGEGCGPSQFSLSSGLTNFKVSDFDLGAFVQDDWRVAPNLTVNAGLRYETQTGIRDHLDFAPRLGLAWAPFAKGKTASKTVVRAGYGIFFTRFPLADILLLERYNGFNQTNYNITAGNPNAALALAAYPGLPDTSLLQIQTQSIYGISQNFRAPYMGQLAVGVDQQLPGRTQVSINFVNTRGVHQLLQRDINAPLPGPYAEGIIERPFAGTGVNGENEDIYEFESDGIFKQTQLNINANSRLNSHLQIQGYYSYSQAHSDANGFPMDQYNLAMDWGRAQFDVRNRGFIGGSIGLPLKLNLNPFITMQSGLPFNITDGLDYDGDGIFNARPAFASCPAVSAYPYYKTKYGCFDAAPAPGAALIPVNYGNGPSQFSVNLRLSRTWGWGERAGANPGPQGGQRGGGPPGGFGGGRGPGGGRGGFGGFGGGGRGGFGGLGGGNTGKRYNLTLSLQARNALNNVNYAAPSGILTSPFFGQSTALNNGGGAGFGGNNGAAGNRKVEIQLRFQF